MAVAVKNTCESHIVSYPDDVEFGSAVFAVKLRQVDICHELEVLVVVVGSFTQQDQVLGRGDLVRVVGRAAAAAVLGLSREDENADSDQRVPACLVTIISRPPRPRVRTRLHWKDIGSVMTDT